MRRAIGLSVLAGAAVLLLVTVSACAGGGGVTPPSNLTYATNPATYTKGEVIERNTPSSGGGAVESYSVSPALPAGLALDASTGVISGTPTAVTATASYVVTAANSGGSATASLSITVQAAYGWLATTPMPTPRNASGVAAASGKIYVIGGWTRQADGTEGYADAVEEYDPVAETWTKKAPAPTLRNEAGATDVDGKVYVMGGYTEDGLTDVVEEYDPAEDSWKAKAPMPMAQAALVAVAVNGKIYAIGGALSAEYDPVADTWRTRAPMPTPRYWFAGAEWNGRIYAIGGWDDPNVLDVTSSYATVEEYDPATDSWRSRAPMPRARGGLAAATLDGRIHVLGGEGFLNTDQEYDPIADAWSAGLPMPTARNGLGAVTIGEALYAVGGWSWHGPLGTVEVYARSESRYPYFAGVPGSPFVWTTAVNSNVVLLAHDEESLFVSNQISNTVSVLAVDPGGALTLLGVYPTGTTPSGMALDTAGQRLYVATRDGIAVHEIGSDRTLSQLGLSPHPAGAGPTPWNGIQHVVPQGGGAFLYVNEGATPTNFVAAYPVLSDGLLGAPATWSTGGPGSSSWMVGPPRLLASGGARLFAGNDGTVSVFDVKQDGSLALVAGSPFASPLPPAPSPAGSVGPYAPALALDPSGTLLYAILDGFTPLRLAVSTGGALELDAPFAESPVYPVTGLSVHPSGRWLTAAYGPTEIRIWNTRTPGDPIVTGRGGIVWNEAGTLAFLGGGSATQAIVDVLRFTQ